MPRWTAILLHGHGGVAVTALAALAAVLIWRRSTPPASEVPQVSWAQLYVLVGVGALGVLTCLVLTTWYLFSPTYLDHIEASAASAAQYFRLGIPLYPSLDAFTFHGLLYGPLLSELNSLGYALGSGVFASKLVGWLAAWAAVGLILALPRGTAWTWAAASTIVLYVLTAFGDALISDRADSLLLLFAAAGLFSVARFSGLSALAMAALLAGGAAALKLHGPIYLVPALYWWAQERWTHEPSHRVSSWTLAAAVAAFAGLLGAVLPFLPANVDVAGYFSYLVLAARHGLLVREFIWNCVCLAGLWAPVGLVWIAVRDVSRELRVFAAVLFGLEAVVCVIGAKPGAGLHHLIPFMGYHALLLQRILQAAGKSLPEQAQAVRGASAALLAALLGTAWVGATMFHDLLVFDRQESAQRVTQQELMRLAHRYPGGMLGVSDETSYTLTNFRPWLTLTGTPQVDYGALMDLRFSGVSDEPLADAFLDCRIPYVFMPREGVPFSLQNHYGGPLFSEAVRFEFQRRYTLIEAGTRFDVFGCEKARPS